MNKLLKAILALLLISVPLFFVFNRVVYGPKFIYYSIYSVSKEVLAQALILILFSVWLMKMDITRQFRLYESPLNLPLLALFSFMAVSSLWAVNHYQSFVFLKRWGCHILLFFVMVNNIRTRKAVRVYTGIMVFAAALVSVYGLAQKFGWDLPFFMHPVLKSPMHVIKLNSTTGNPNFAGAYVAAIIPLALCRRHKRWLFYALAGVMAVYLVVIATRAAWVGLIGAVVIMCSRASRKNRITFLMILIAGITIILLSPPSRQRFISIFDTACNTNRQRIEIWKVTATMIKDRPFRGVGIGNFNIVYPLYQTEHSLASHGGDAHFIRQTHNEYLQLISEIGLIGYGLFLWFAFTLIWTLWSRGEVALLGSVTATLITAMFSFNLQNEISALTFWSVVGMSRVKTKGGLL